MCVFYIYNILKKPTSPSKPRLQVMPLRVDCSAGIKERYNRSTCISNTFSSAQNKYQTFMSYYTDGPQVLDPVAAAVINGTMSKQLRLPDSSSIYTAELKTLTMAFDMITNNKNKFFIIYANSLLSLMAHKVNTTTSLISLISFISIHILPNSTKP